MEKKTVLRFWFLSFFAVYVYFCELFEMFLEEEQLSYGFCLKYMKLLSIKIPFFKVTYIHCLC